MTDEVRGGFLHRWSRRKVQARQGQRLDDEPRQDEGVAGVVPDEVGAAASRVAPSHTVESGAAATEIPDPGVTAAGGQTPDPRAPRPDVQSEKSEPAPLTLDDVKTLTSDSDFAPFVSQQVDPQVRNAALKKLFSDPHYNVMDGLDIYIDDYSQLEPLPAPMLRRMASAQALKMFETLTEDGENAPIAQASDEHREDAERSRSIEDARPDAAPAPPEQPDSPDSEKRDAQPAPSAR